MIESQQDIMIALAIMTPLALAALFLIGGLARAAISEIAHKLAAYHIERGRMGYAKRNRIRTRMLRH